MGNYKSTRWPESYEKKRTVESVRRITPREARHVAAPTVEAPVAGTSARRLYCLCPRCQKRSVFLYQLDPASGWACRDCCAGGLIYSRQQQRGTRQAFVEWFTPERRERMAAQHPARRELIEWYGSEWFRQCAPYDHDRADEARQRELAEQFGSVRAVRWEYERRVDAFMERLQQKENETGQRINADIWAFWQRRHRSQRRR